MELTTNGPEFVVSLSETQLDRLEHLDYMCHVCAPLEAAGAERGSIQYSKRTGNTVRFKAASRESAEQVLEALKRVASATNPVFRGAWPEHSVSTRKPHH